MDSGSYILGKEVESFEKALSKTFGMKHSIAVANGTDAITLSLQALGIGLGSRVLTVANSAPPTVLAIRRTGASVVYADVDSEGLVYIPKLTNALLVGINAFVPVHLYGRVVDLQLCRDGLEHLRIPIVEDACQAYGAFSPHYKIGESSATVCLSFYPTKNLGAIGDGGAILTNTDVLAERLRRLRHYGLDKGIIKEYGMNSRLDELQAAILKAKMADAEIISKRKLDINLFYYELLCGIEDYCRTIEPTIGDNGHLMPIFAEDRDQLQNFLEKQGIGTQIHYKIPAHRQPCEINATRLPMTEKLCSHELSLPNWYGMTDEQVRTVARLVRKFYGRS